MGTNRDRLISRLHIYNEEKNKKSPRRKDRTPTAAAGLELPKEWKQKGDFTYVREFTAPYRVSDPLYCPILHPEPLNSNQIIFYDTETTGLSGGAGTRIFLTGFGSPVNEGIRVRQFFLSDFPGEYEYLDLIARQFAADAVFVSFNGKGYDSHLLRSRFAMNGIQFQFPRQIDLLHPARRLWRNIIGSCSLGNIETEILGVHREADIPGYLVPEVYFSYLRTGNTRELLDVFHHNCQDVVSLAILLETFGKVYEQPTSMKVDSEQLGLLLCRIGETELGGSLLLKSFQAGSGKAGRILGFSHKRRGERKEAAAIWGTLWERDRDLVAAVELAKHLEHKVRDLDRAMRVVEEMDQYVKGADYKSVPKRLHRDVEKRKIRLAGKRFRRDQKK